MTEEEKKAINNLNFIFVTDVYDNEVNIDKTKIINEYNHSVGIVLNLITKIQKENEELTTALNKQSKDIGNYLAELQQKDKQIDLMAENITLFKSEKENPKVPDWCSGAKIVSLSKEEIKEYFEKLAKEKT